MGKTLAMDCQQVVMQTNKGVSERGGGFKNKYTSISGYEALGREAEGEGVYEAVPCRYWV